MKLSERMIEIFKSSQDLTVWVAYWIDETVKLEAVVEAAKAVCDESNTDVGYIKSWPKLEKALEDLEE